MRGVYKHIPTGKIVYLINGEYQINGRISNHYSGNVFNENFELTDETLGDYGISDKWEKVKDYKIKLEIDKSK
jgi:hypothetical protein